MTGFEIFRHYVALKTHFNSDSYDYLKYGGKSTVKRQTYENRKDKQFFERLSNKHMSYTIPFLVANFVANKNLWIGDLTVNQESEETYFAWKKKMSRLWSITSEEMLNMETFMEKRGLKFNDLFKKQADSQPVIFRLMIQRYISMETYIIMDVALGFSTQFDAMLKGDVIYEQWSLKLRKYEPFLNLAKEDCVKITRDVFLPNG